MKIDRNKKIYGLISIGVLLLSLVFALVDYIVPLNLWTHPALNFLFCAFIGFGIFGAVYGLRNKVAMYVLVGAILLGLASYYLTFQYIGWLMSLLVIFTVWAVFAIVGYVCLGNKAEKALNDEPDYQSFQVQREKAKSEENSQPEELPQLKTFK